MPASSRKTATFASIVSPSSSLISETRRPEPFSRAAIAAIFSSSASSTATEGRETSIRLAREAASTPERRPKISVSSSELAPSRLPPWTETQAVSPAA